MVVTTRQQAKRRKLDMEASEAAAARQAQGEEAAQESPEEPENNLEESISSNDIIQGHVSESVRSILMDAADGPSISVSIPSGHRPRHSKTAPNPATRPRNIALGSTASHECARSDNHDMLVHIAPFGEKVRYGQRSAMAIGHDYFRFRCPLGDVWHDFYTDVCRHRLLRTGDQWIDRAVRSLPFQGFDMVHVVGSGRHSFVVAANCPQKYTRMVAIKILLSNNPKPARKVSVQDPALAPWHVEYPDEVDMQRNLSHPNIVKWLDYMTYMNRQCIVMEFCQIGDIEDLLQMNPGKFFAESVARRYFTGMLSAIEYLHSQGLVHLDINCRNWVVDRDNVVKLIDFGSSRRWTPGQPLMMQSAPGSPAYRPPEVLLQQPYNPRSADVWALGIVLNKMVTSRLPFGAEPYFIPGSLRVVSHPDPRVLALSREVKQLLEAILHPDVSVRYSLNRIKQSPWMKVVITSSICPTSPPEDKFYVSNFYRVRQPVKVREGTLERRWKHSARLTKLPPRHAAWAVHRRQVCHATTSASAAAANITSASTTALPSSAPMLTTTTESDDVTGTEVQRRESTETSTSTSTSSSLSDSEEIPSTSQEVVIASTSQDVVPMATQ